MDECGEAVRPKFVAMDCTRIRCVSAKFMLIVHLLNVKFNDVNNVSILL